MAQAAARGPLSFLLQSSSGQYAVMGMGVYTLFPDQVKRALAPLLTHPAFRAQFGDLSEGSETGMRSNQMAPIIIQTPSPTVISGQMGSKSLSTVIIYSVAGAGACWVGYIVCSNLLPDAIQEFMPVTKRLFKQTSETLGRGILQVKEILEEQITQLMGQQEVLEKKQDETHKTVRDVQSELGKARLDLLNLQNSLDRCEDGLNNTQEMQGYSLRGIKLLVRCITSFLPDESNFIDDIARYVEDGASPQPNNTTGAPALAQPRPAGALPPSAGQPSTAMARHTTLPASAGNTAFNPPANQIFVNYDRNAPVVVAPAVTKTSSPSAAPSIASIDSDDYSSSPSESQNASSMAAIKALLGH